MSAGTVVWPFAVMVDSAIPLLLELLTVGRLPCGPGACKPARPSGRARLPSLRPSAVTRCQPYQTSHVPDEFWGRGAYRGLSETVQGSGAVGCPVCAARQLVTKDSDSATPACGSEEERVGNSIRGLAWAALAGLVAAWLVGTRAVRALVGPLQRLALAMGRLDSLQPTEAGHLPSQPASNAAAHEPDLTQRSRVAHGQQISALLKLIATVSGWPPSARPGNGPRRTGLASQTKACPRRLLSSLRQAPRRHSPMLCALLPCRHPEARARWPTAVPRAPNRSARAARRRSHAECRVA